MNCSYEKIKAALRFMHLPCKNINQVIPLLLKMEFNLAFSMGLDYKLNLAFIQITLDMFGVFSLCETECKILNAKKKAICK